MQEASAKPLSRRRSSNCSRGAPACGGDLAARTPARPVARRPRCRCAPAASSSGGPAPPGPPAVLICPGFLSDHRGRECVELRASLERHFESGRAPLPPPPALEVLPIRRSDWYPTLRGGSFGFYVSALADAASSLASVHGRVSVVALSAAGWIARLALGNRPYEGASCGVAPLVDTLVTLGTPHYSLEAYPFGRVPERRSGEDGADLPPEVRASSLRLANALYPDAESLSPAHLACVCGTGVVGSSAGLGRRLAALASGGTGWRPFLDEWFAAVSYEAACGRRDVDGDGVTPDEAAFVPGARRVLLPGVWHSPSGGRPWYGSQAVVPLWAAYLSSGEAAGGAPDGAARGAEASRR